MAGVADPQGLRAMIEQSAHHSTAFPLANPRRTLPDKCWRRWQPTPRSRLSVFSTNASTNLASGSI